jgi:O-antigen ligase
MYLSRTMLIVGIILYLSIKGYTLIRYRSIKIIAIIISIVLLFYVYLFSVKIDRNAKGFEGFLYKMKIAPSEIFLSKIDRENHKDLWDHWRGYEANRAFALMKQSPSSYLVGTGFGSLIDLKFNSPLGDQKKGLRYISEIHNGYVFVLYKTGIIGLLLLLIFLINLYLKGYHRKNFIFIMISSISVTYFFTTLTITGIFNKRDIIILLLGAFLYYGTKNEQIVQADESK